MRMSAVPAKLNSDTRPSAPTPTVTMFGTVPTMAFTLDESGCGVPFGQSVTYVDAVGFTTVTFSATAPAPAGTPPAPATATWRVSPGPRRTPHAPDRVSMMRAGATAWKPSVYQPA